MQVQDHGLENTILPYTRFILAYQKKGTGCIFPCHTLKVSSACLLDLF